ncbi:MAG: galactokinase [Sphingomonadaceae bacterium]|nr:galactokinase [Sphingomonadaceae bacterium]
MSDLDARVRAGFANHFGGVPTFVAWAPGRVNLIGEHTDYNDGFALPAAVAEETRIAIRPRANNIVNAVALDFDATDSFALDAIAKTGGWADYLRGVIIELCRKGYRIGGADIAIAGNIPKGTGLSSSASLEIAVIRGFLALDNLPFDPVAAALVGQAAENDFVGMRCGNLDQLAVAGAQPGAAVLIDCRRLSLSQIPLPPDCAIVIVQSGVERGLVDGAYNDRRAQCEEAARILGVAALRDATMTMLEAADMPDIVFRRARHVITENARTLAAAGALRVADYATLGWLMAESHASMRDDFEITVPLTDALADFMNAALAVRGGARQTGGGFGGAVVALTDSASSLDLGKALRRSRLGCSLQPPTVIGSPSRKQPE